MTISAYTDGVEITMRSIDPTLTSTSVSGKIQTRKVSGQRWAATVKFSPLARDNLHFRDYFVNGQHQLFLLGLPFVPANYESGDSTTYRLNGAHAAGDTTLTVDEFDFTPARGDWIGINSKIYFVENFSSNTIRIYPALAGDADDNTTILGFPSMACRLANDIQEYSYSPSRYVETEIEVIEHLY